MGRVAVIGDVGGHLSLLEAELARLGATPDLPPDLTVIQVGDLVHRGPDSEGVVDLVSRHLPTGRWIQLVGNHEAQYLAQPRFEWSEQVSCAGTLRAWWASGAMRAAAAVTAAGEQWLITHAGLTEGFWRLGLDAPTSAAHAAAALNSFIGTHDDVLFSAGHMLGGGAPNLTAGPVWAAAGTELIPSWSDVELPFSQVHGHSSVVNWWRREWTCPPEVARLISLDVERAHSVAALPGGRIVGVDPGHGTTGRVRWGAYVLLDAEVVA